MQQPNCSMEGTPDIKWLTNTYQRVIVKTQGGQLSTIFRGKFMTIKEKQMKQKLTDAEWKVMAVLWEQSPRTMMEITNALKEETGWSKHTVMSFLKRMEEKGALHFTDGGKAKLYYPDWEREAAQMQETEEFLNKMFHGKIGLMLHAMVQQNALSEQEIDELNRILNEAEK